MAGLLLAMQKLASKTLKIKDLQGSKLKKMEDEQKLISFKMNQIEDVFPLENGDYHCYVTLLECKSKEKTSPSWRVIYQN